MAKKTSKKSAAKQQEEVRTISMLGRAKNTLKMGLVGLPNVGKSLTFNILTKLDVPSENFPFCTVDPTTAKVPVPDKRLTWLNETLGPKKLYPASLHVTDIAGLVKGAHEGLGLGNAFLSHIRAVDGIFHVVRVFDDMTVGHVEGDIDPCRDLAIISNELIQKDLQVLKSRLADCERKVKMENPLATLQFPILQRIQSVLEQGEDIRRLEWDASSVAVINELQLLSAKPVVYLLNMSERDYLRQGNKHLPKIVDWVKARNPRDTLLPFSAQLEASLMEMDAGQRDDYLAGSKTESMIGKIIKAGYKALHCIHYYTIGELEIHCWTIRKYTKAPVAAGAIHTDFVKHFVRAEVCHYADMRALKSDAAVRAAGKMHSEGKDYVVQNSDIIHFNINKVKRGKK